MTLSALGTITTGKQKRPPRLVVYGTEGIGKSTFAASAPKPIFLPTEDGLGEIDCAHFPLLESYSAFMEGLTALCTEAHEYETVVIDTVDWLEKLVWKETCRNGGKANLEDFGYGKGYLLALDAWSDALSALDFLRGKGLAIILLAHSRVERFEDPESSSYDRYTLRLHKHADALIREWADAVLFATRTTRIEKEDLGFKKTRGIAVPIGHAEGGDRILRTVGGPACVAKNRYGITGDIPLSWDAFAAHL